MPEIEIVELTKTYDKGKVKAVDRVTISVNKGEIFGLIGPDGAGKTSIFRVLTTLLVPDEGSATVSGWDVVKDYKSIRRNVGYMPGKFSLYPDLSVEENLNFFATVFGTTIKDNYDLIEDIYTQLEPFKDRRAQNLSGGMKQKLALCCALVHKPKVLFLDEPTTGVDTVSRKEFWDMLKGIKERGITIMVSTAYMDEALRCERIGLIQNGQMLTIDTPEGVISKYPDQLYAVKSENMSKLLHELRSNDKVETCFAFGEYHHITLKTENAEVELTNELESKFPHSEIKKIKPTVEDCFIQLMSKPWPNL